MRKTKYEYFDSTTTSLFDTNINDNQISGSIFVSTPAPAPAPAPTSTTTTTSLFNTDMKNNTDVTNTLTTVSTVIDRKNDTIVDNIFNQQIIYKTEEDLFDFTTKNGIFAYNIKNFINLYFPNIYHYKLFGINSAIESGRYNRLKTGYMRYVENILYTCIKSFMELGFMSCVLYNVFTENTFKNSFDNTENSFDKFVTLLLGINLLDKIINKNSVNLYLLNMNESLLSTTSATATTSATSNKLYLLYTTSSTKPTTIDPNNIIDSDEKLENVGCGDNKWISLDFLKKTFDEIINNTDGIGSYIQNNLLNQTPIFKPNSIFSQERMRLFFTDYITNKINKNTDIYSLLNNYEFTFKTYAESKINAENDKKIKALALRKAIDEFAQVLLDQLPTSSSVDNNMIVKDFANAAGDYIFIIELKKFLQTVFNTSAAVNQTEVDKRRAVLKTAADKVKNIFGDIHTTSSVIGSNMTTSSIFNSSSLTGAQSKYSSLEGAPLSTNPLMGSTISAVVENFSADAIFSSKIVTDAGIKLENAARESAQSQGYSNYCTQKACRDRSYEVPANNTISGLTNMNQVLSYFYYVCYYPDEPVAHAQNQFLYKCFAPYVTNECRQLLLEQSSMLEYGPLIEFNYDLVNPIEMVGNIFKSVIDPNSNIFKYIDDVNHYIYERGDVYDTNTGGYIPADAWRKVSKAVTTTICMFLHFLFYCIFETMKEADANLKTQLNDIEIKINAITNILNIRLRECN